jgi:hypothetical protein
LAVSDEELRLAVTTALTVELTDFVERVNPADVDPDGI